MRQPSDTTASGGLDYWKGFFSAILLIVMTLIGHAAATWAATNPVITGVYEFLTAPAFSLLDVLGFGMVLFVIYMVVWMAAFGPRVN